MFLVCCKANKWNNQSSHHSHFSFCLSFPVYYGFYNYCFSIPFAFLFIGSWMKFREARLLKQSLVLFPVSFLLFITHIFGWFVAGIFLASAFLIENIPF